MNALTVLKHDHGNIEVLFDRFQHLDSGDLAEKGRLAQKIIEHLAVHAAIEEQVFYPGVRAAVPDAGPTVLEGLEEHHIVKWTLSELERTAPSDERFDAKMRVLIESVRHHVQEEENDLFPKVRDVLTNQELEEMGDALEAAREVAPTRPHPRQPDTPPLNVLIGLPAAMFDRAVRTGRDAVGQLLKKVS